MFLLQVAQSGTLGSGDTFWQVIRQVFGPNRHLPCIGLNSSKHTRGFSRLSFSTKCGGLCEDIKADNDTRRVAGRCLHCSQALSGQKTNNEVSCITKCF